MEGYRIKDVDPFQKLTSDYNLSVEWKKIQNLHSIWSKGALMLYFYAAQPLVTTCKQGFAMIDREYNSPVRQNRMKNYLISLKLK